MMTPLAWLTFLVAALMEVGGDAMIRHGLRTRGMLTIVGGVAILGAYGLLVNTVKWDFSKLLGVYVAIFATMGVLFGHFAFREVIPQATWIGLALIVIGGCVIQFGSGQ